MPKPVAVGSRSEQDGASENGEAHSKLQTERETVRTDQIEFNNTTFHIIAPYPSSRRRGKVRMLRTIGEWESPSGRQYIGEWLTKDNPYSSTYSCLAQEGFKLYAKLADGAFEQVGKFEPVHSHREEGGECVPVMSWRGEFTFRGSRFKWEGSCVWELSTLISDWEGELDDPLCYIGVAKGALLALKKAGAIKQ